MKKMISVALILVMTLLMLTGCAADGTTGATAAPATEPVKPALTDSLETIIGRSYAQQSVEFAIGTIPVDLTDTTEDGLWALKSYTGLDSADQITEAAVSEAMIGSIPYSLVLVRVADGADAQTVAEAMKAGIDQRKWICVEANSLQVSGYGDVVMLVMIGSDYGSAQTFTDAFRTVCGGELDFTI